MNDAPSNGNGGMSYAAAVQIMAERLIYVRKLLYEREDRPLSEYAQRRVSEELSALEWLIPRLLTMSEQEQQHDGS